MGNRIDLDNEWIGSLYQRGIKVQTIANHLGVSRYAIYTALHRGGIDLPSHSERIARILTPEREAELVSLYEQKTCNVVELSARFNLSGHIVYRRLREAGVERNHFTGPKVHFVQYASQSGRLCRFRSTWEKTFAEYLDERDLEWGYESHSYLLSDGTAYTPDFWVPSWQLFVEVKGRMTDEAQRKIELFRQEYPLLRLIVANRKTFALYGIQLPQNAAA